MLNEFRVLQQSAEERCESGIEVQRIQKFKISKKVFEFLNLIWTENVFNDVRTHVLLGLTLPGPSTSMIGPDYHYGDKDEVSTLLGWLR